jgi:hypothetical protein
MKIRQRYTIIIGVLLLWIASVLVASISAQSRGHRNALGQYEVDICRETHHGMFAETAQVTWTQGKSQTCAADMRSISKNYVALDGLVYWMKNNSYTESPCIHGTGDTTAVFHNLSLECLTSRSDQVNVHEDRDLTLTARLSPAFHRIVDDGGTYREVWQGDQLEHFAADASSVYFESQKIDGADPRDFSVAFPFTDGKWSEFHFSKSRGKLFVNGVSIPEMDVSRFELLKFVDWPDRGVKYAFDATLTIEPNSDTFGSKGVLGRIGSDLVYLRRDGATIFRNMASTGAFVFIEPQHMYLSSAGQFYDVVWDADRHVALLAVVDADTINRRYKAELDGYVNLDRQ